MPTEQLQQRIALLFVPGTDATLESTGARVRVAVDEASVAVSITLGLPVAGLRDELHAALAALLQQQGLGLARLELQRSEEHTSELQSLMRISYAVFCLKKK